MPELDFLGAFDSTNRESVLETAIKLDAVMLYPCNRQRREEYITFSIINAAQMKARSQLGEPVADITGVKKYDEWFSQLVEMHKYDGGNDVRIRVHNGAVSGMVLHYIAALERSGKKGSFQKAYSLLHKEYSTKDKKMKDKGGNVVATSPTKIKEAWSEFKSIAHLWAASNIYPRIFCDEKQLYNPARFIPLAEWFREFGETTTQLAGPNSGEPYLNPNDTWQPPETFDFTKLTTVPEVIFWDLPD